MKTKKQNPVKVAMDLRYGKTVSTMRDRRERRLKDYKNSWQKESYISD